MNSQHYTHSKTILHSGYCLINIMEITLLNITSTSKRKLVVLWYMKHPDWTTDDMKILDQYWSPFHHIPNGCEHEWTLYSWKSQLIRIVYSFWWYSSSFCGYMVTVVFASYAVCHNDVIKWKYFPRYWPFVRGIHRPPVNSPHKCQWRGALMFSLIFAWTNSWANHRDAGDLRRHALIMTPL